MPLTTPDAVGGVRLRPLRRGRGGVGGGGHPYRFAGAHGYHSDAGTGLARVGFRYLQPQVGRWTQPDPLGARVNAGFPAEAGAYVYAGCDPVNWVDPSGAIGSLEACIRGALAGAGVRASAFLVGAAVAAVVPGLGFVGLAATLGPIALAAVEGCAAGVALDAIF